MQGLAHIKCPAHMKPVACVDIGGTKIAVSIADAAGLRGRSTEATVKKGASDAIGKQAVRMVKAVCRQQNIDWRNIASVGVSTTGPLVRQANGLAINNPNLCGGMSDAAQHLSNTWVVAAIEAPLREYFKTVHVAIDVVAALVAERRWGALQGSAHCAYVTWSTGIGAGICVDGHVLYGKNGNAGHIGHSFASTHSGIFCGCGNEGDVEAVCGGQSLSLRCTQIGFSDTKTLFTAAKAGHTQAVQMVDEACLVMARALYNLCAVFDLERISLGGSVFWHHSDYLLPKLEHQVIPRLPAFTKGVKLLSSGLGQAVGDYAALALCMPD